MSPSLSFPAWQGVAATFHIVALLTTSWRLIHRRRTRGLWWDDYWAALAMLIDVIYFAVVWLRNDPNGRPLTVPQGVRVFWLSTITFPSVVWAARASIAFSILRFIPRKTSKTARQSLYGLLVAFLLMWLALLLQKAYVCGHDNSWHVPSRNIQCFLGRPVGIITLTTDVIGDAGLIFATLYVFASVQPHAGRRLLILSILTSSIISTMAGIVYAVFVFQSTKLGPARGSLISLSANIKASVTLFVCNLFVIASWARKLQGTDEDVETHIATTVSQDVAETQSKASSDSSPEALKGSV